MKKLIMIFLGGFVWASCNDGGTAATTTETDSAATTTETVAQKMNYPYTIDHPDYWETGSTENTMNVLSALKAFENGNVDESVKYFADSVRIQFDGLDKKLSNDSLRAMFDQSRKSMKTMSITMQDWESVVSKDKKVEYVTMWYRERWEDTKGKTDSVDVVNDVKMKDGKMIELTQYERKLN